jgi:histidine triad (HIT) family protein
MTSQCLFCRIIAGEIPSNCVYSDDYIYAFRDINPVAPTHILVIPRKHLSSINDSEEADEALMGKLLLGARRIARDLALAEDGYRLVVNTGVNGGQTVFHLHMHILGDRQLSWPPG